ncbi:hypothetical protein [Xenorhabdus thuongxuanensis]|uniref:Uncharacterized protein n=1 Tax=Xenorhabdus thuongxuanensis TaxID=1873484 RepID=A0A1Q5TYW7_9GAMM|nr:hypothetical protein Xentx_02457 [Xenorhabdus thuongxuanensis]
MREFIQEKMCRGNWNKIKILSQFSIRHKKIPPIKDGISFKATNAK